MRVSRIARSAIAAVILLLIALSFVPAASAADANWRAEYFNNVNLSGNPVLVQNVPSIDLYWGDRTTLPPGVRRENSSIRWTRTVNFNPAGTYRFSATMDDGMRVWVDNALIIDQWQTGPTRTFTADRFLSAGDHALRVEFFNGPLDATAIFSWQMVSGTPPPPTSFSGWRGEYFNNQSLQGTPALIRDDAAINFNWGLGSPAAGIVGADNFSVRWARSISLNQGRYRFDARTDDGVRVWVNNVLIIDRWIQQPVTSVSGEINVAGGSTPVVMEYFESVGDAQAFLTWTQISGATPPPPSAGTATVMSSNLNVRQGPGTNYPILTVVPQGTVLTLAGFRDLSGTWVQVTTPSGVTGWSYTPLLSTTFPIMSLPVWSGESTTPPGQPTGTVSGASYLNVRTEPNGTVITTVRGGTQVGLLGRDKDLYWLKVVLPTGVQGWVASRYIQTTFPVMGLPILYP